MLSQEKLSPLTGLDERSIRRSIKRLKEVGCLTVEASIKQDADRGLHMEDSVLYKARQELHYFFLDNEFFKQTLSRQNSGVSAHTSKRQCCLNNTDTVH